MGLVLQVSSLVLKISWAFAVFLVLLGSADDADPTSPESFNAISPVGEGTTGPVPQWKQLRKNAPSPSSQSNVVSPPLSSPPTPETTKDQGPLLSPSTPMLSQPSNSSAPPTPSPGIIPSLPPSVSQGQPPPTEDPVSVPKSPVPLASPSVKSPAKSPSFQPVMPGSVPSRSQHSQTPDDKAPLAAPIAPVQSAPPPREMLPTLPTSQPIVPTVPENKAPLPAPIAPVQIAPPPREMLQMPPTSQPILPKVPDYKAPLPAPIAPVQIAPPPRNTLHTPTIQPTVPQVQITPPPKGMLQMPPTSQPSLPELPDNKAPSSVPLVPVQSAPPPREMLPTPPTSQPIVPKVPDNKAPLPAPIAPVQIAPPPREMLQTPPTSQPILPKVPDYKAPLPTPIAPVQIAPPPRNTLQTPTIQPTVPQVQITPPPKGILQMPPTSQPSLPELPGNKAPSSVPLVPVHTAPPPPRDMLRTPPTSQPTVPEVQSAPPPRGMLQMPPTSQPNMPKVPDNKAPLSTPIAPVHIAPPPREMQLMPPRSQPIVPKIPPSNRPVPATSPPHNLPRYSPPIQPEGRKVRPSISPVPATSPSHNLPRYPPPTQPEGPKVRSSISPESYISPISATHPSSNSKEQGIPVSAPSHVAPKHLPPPNLSPETTPKNSSPRDAKTAPPPATSSYRHHHARINTTTPGPSSYLVPPPASADIGGRPPSPGSPARASPSHQTRMPFLSPEISPSGSSPMVPKIPHMQPIRAFPPPPPNAECKPLSCAEPLTNTLPGFSCACILPMQVGLRLGVALYTFFPLVSEFATEIAAGVFFKPSQVRIMGANAATEDPEKTIVLMDLVPFGEDFDNNTAYLTYQRFWHKQVSISTSYFGDYEVLYVRYTGLPDSPPSAPSSDNEPHDSQGRTIKPVGVDIGRGQHKKGLKGSLVVVIVLSTLVALILFCAIAWIMFFRHRDHDFQVQQNPPTKLPSLAKSSGIATSMTGSGPSSISASYYSTIAPYTGTAKTFTLNDMERATDNFAASKILGEGGFGLVYGGVLDDGTKVAVKVLKRDDQQGDREFLAEVEMLSRLHHRNLVTLIGICTEEHARCLVYELIPNGSVESHLHGVDKEDAPLDWGSRLKIALGAARGLAYLHEDSSPRVIHRDFKSSNILLEHDFTPKVSDFGLARSALDEENRHISTRVMGTFGYVAPEYAMTGHLLVKSDVYSYGVVLLELLTGRKPVDMSQPPGQENLVTWSRPLLTSEEGLELIVDKSLGANISFDSISKVAAIASMCVQPEVSHRPFMGEVVQALKLVLNECDATKDLGSRSCSQEDLSVDFDARSSTHSDHLPDLLRMQSPISDYESAITVERGLPLSEIFSASARIGKTDSESFRRHSSSGPLRSESVLPLWQRMRRLSGGSVSEHGAMFKLWHGYH